MPEMVVRWCTHCWVAIGGRKFYILGVAGLCTPIWDVLTAQGEWVGAGEHLCGDRFVELSQLGKWCQLDFGLGFAPGLVWLGFSTAKMCIIVYKVYLHIIYHFIHLWARENGWMALTWFG